MAYERAVQSYRKTSVETANQIKLIVLCYEGAIQAINQAKISYEQGDFESKVNHLIKAQNIIQELYSSLNREKGGIIAVNLANLYSYTLNRLVQGDVEKDLGAFDEVMSLLTELLAAWQEISTDKSAKAEFPNNSEITPVAPRGISI